MRRRYEGLQPTSDTDSDELNLTDDGALVEMDVDELLELIREVEEEG